MGGPATCEGWHVHKNANQLRCWWYVVHVVCGVWRMWYVRHAMHACVMWDCLRHARVHSVAQSRTHTAELLRTWSNRMSCFK
jgi:hypothetical protein